MIDGVLPQRRLRYVMVRGEAGALQRWLGAGGGGLGSVIRVGPRQVIGTSLGGATSRTRVRRQAESGAFWRRQWNPARQEHLMRHTSGCM